MLKEFIKKHLKPWHIGALSALEITYISYATSANDSLSEHFFRGKLENFVSAGSWALKFSKGNNSPEIKTIYGPQLDDDYDGDRLYTMTAVTTRSGEAEVQITLKLPAELLPQYRGIFLPGLLKPEALIVTLKGPKEILEDSEELNLQVAKFCKNIIGGVCAKSSNTLDR